MTTAIGLDVGGSKIAAALTTERGEVLAERRLVHPGGSRLFLPAMVEVARELGGSQASALGVGMAGLVEWPEGRFIWGPHLPMTNVPVRDLLEEELGLPVVVDNDANMAGFGEAHIGAGVGHNNVLFVALGTGIGGSLILGGKVHRGRSFAGEFGHMCIDPDGPICACGRRGCWETFVSGPLLAQAAADLGVGAGGAELTAAALEADPLAIGAFNRLGKWLGLGLANLIAVLDPDVVVVGGGASAAGDLLLAPARASIASRLEGAEHRAPVEVVVAALGPGAGTVGAALMALEVSGEQVHATR